MAEMLVKSESLVSIADKIRVLKGITKSMSLDDMETELDVIPKNDSTDLTASGATVTVPAGYYATQATKSVATATQATPSVSIDSAGKITATATQTAGYVSAGIKTGTKQLTTQTAKTITPSTSSQTAVASGVYTTGAVTVAAIPSKYVDNSTVDAVESDVMSGKKYGASGSVKTGTFSLDSELNSIDNLITQINTALEGKAVGSEPVLQTKTVTPTTSVQNVTPDASYDGLSNVTVNAIPSTYVNPSVTKAETTYIPTTYNQTIAAGTYCSGVQTISGDINLIASNIKSGVSIFGVNGNYIGSSSDSIPTVMYNSGNITSTAAGGSVIYTTVETDGKLYTNYYGFNTFPIAGLYLYTLPPEVALNTPIIILSSGTITLSGATLITSGTGYAIYMYT